MARSQQPARIPNEPVDPRQQRKSRLFLLAMLLPWILIFLMWWFAR